MRSKVLLVLVFVPLYQNRVDLLLELVLDFFFLLRKPPKLKAF